MRTTRTIIPSCARSTRASLGQQSSHSGLIAKRSSLSTGVQLCRYRYDSEIHSLANPILLNAPSADGLEGRIADHDRTSLKTRMRYDYYERPDESLAVSGILLRCLTVKGGGERRFQNVVCLALRRQWR